MCGLCGFIDWKRSLPKEKLNAVVTAMADRICHRGPDDCGTWVADDAGVALGHRRLAILDLSAEGHQPMGSPSGRFVCVYNGEVYNYLALRKQLEAKGYGFRGHCDTEVILAAFEEWGIEKAVSHFIGMFAMALVDRQAACLYLIRDRLGIKPLYYGWCQGTFLFASELKSMQAHPDWEGRIDRDALEQYFQYNYIPSPFSIYQSIYKLPAGCLLRVPLDRRLSPSDFSPYPEADLFIACPLRYWSAADVYRHGIQNPFAGSEGDAIEQLDHLLKDAVSIRMIADTPLGAFLSGGVDSSTVVALMQESSTLPVKTFSIGFSHEEFNEAKFAREIAAHLGTDHTELMVEPKDALAVISSLPAMFDEPFADSSQIPTYLLCKMTRNHVTVALSGDGGDELFAGYNSYYWTQALWERLRWLPTPVRPGLLHAVQLLLDHVGWVPADWSARWNALANNLYKGCGLGRCTSLEEMYERFQSVRHQTPALVLGGTNPDAFKDMPYYQTMMKLSDPLKKQMYRDVAQYMVDDILTKVDRASMAVSLEARVPVIDHRVVEFAARLPNSFLYREGKRKWILRQVLYKRVPAPLIERPKQGFGIPLHAWLAGPLRDWAEQYLDPARIAREGYLDAPQVQRIWVEHRSGRRDWKYRIWGLLMFETWLEANQNK
jgi:asparagine synthase (glutamine-hydrolysing)